MKAFHVPMNAKIPRVASAGFESGSTILQKIIHSLAPSILAASSRFFGRVKKNCLSKKVPHTLKKEGTIRAQYVSIQFKALTIKKEGISVTIPGIIMVDRNIQNIESLPGKLILEKA
jgi:hypothetical protein